jgi:hypothetical protein
MLVLWRILLFAALWLGFEFAISWAAFCQHQNEYNSANQSAESYECVFRGPIASLARWFGGWWVHIFDKADTYIALFTLVLAVGTLALWWSTRKLWNAAIENERPWVGTVTVQPDNERNPFGAEIIIRNTGRRPALKMRIAHRGEMLELGTVQSAFPQCQ